jgi:hypothetical protein
MRTISTAKTSSFSHRVRGLKPATGPLPEPAPLYPSITELRAATRAAVDRAVEGDGDELHVIAHAAGSGKTSALIAALAAQKAGGTLKRTMILLNSLALCHEKAEEARASGLGAVVVEGRNARNCSNFAVVEPVQKANCAANLVCGKVFDPDPNLKCPFADRCAASGYWSQLDVLSIAEIAFIPHARLALPMDKSILANFEPELLVIDEAILGTVVKSSAVPVDSLTAPLHTVLRPWERALNGIAYANARCDDAARQKQRTELWERVVASIGKDLDPAKELIGAGLIDHIDVALRIVRGQISDDVEIGPRLTEADARSLAYRSCYRHARAEAAALSVLKRRVAWLTAEAGRRGIAVAELETPKCREIILRVEKDRRTGDQRRYLDAYWVSKAFRDNIDPPAPEADLLAGLEACARKRPACIVLDAHAHPRILERLFPGRRIHISRGRAMAPNATLIQVVDRTMSNASLLPSRRASERARLAAGELAADMMRAIDLAAARHRSLLLSATRDVIELVRRAYQQCGRMLPPNVAMLSFGRARGTNDFEQFQAVMVLGRMQPPKHAMDGHAAALMAREWIGPIMDGGEQFPLREAVYRMRDGRAFSRCVPLPTDFLVADILATSRENEIEQAIARLRLEQRIEPVTVYIVCSLPLQIELDELCSLADLAGREHKLEALTLACDGITPLSAFIVEAIAKRAGGAIEKEWGGGRHRARHQLDVLGLTPGAFAGALGDEARRAALRTIAPEVGDEAPVRIVSFRYVGQPGSPLIAAVWPDARLLGVEKRLEALLARIGKQLDRSSIEILYSPPAAVKRSYAKVRQVANAAIGRLSELVKRPVSCPAILSAWADKVGVLVAACVLAAAEIRRRKEDAEDALWEYDQLLVA